MFRLCLGDIDMNFKKIGSLVGLLGLCVPLLFLSGCAHTIKRKSLMTISIGMTKEQIIKKLGDPSIFRGSMVNKFSQTIEVFEYDVDRGKSGNQITAETIITISTLGLGAPIFLSKGQIETLWFYFYDNKLVQWGKAGDWQAQATAIYEVRFGPSL